MSEAPGQALTVIQTPDSGHVAALVPSPNIEPRMRGLKPSMIILHYTGLPTFEKSIEVLSRADCKVSCHYVVDTDGRIVQMVQERLRAWHAGVSFWQGETDINSVSIGIEIQNPGHTLGYPDFPAAQMDAVIRLSRDIMDRHDIPRSRVLAHSDVAPQRKIDPGEKFDWAALAREGIGDWVQPVEPDPEDAGLDVGADNPAVREARQRLQRYGYGLPGSGALDVDMAFVLRAFQLHFRPQRIDSRLDGSTLLTLRRLTSGLADELV
jgi:N-acetylmuramoyl-L-alanine amidase